MPKNQWEDSKTLFNYTKTKYRDIILSMNVKRRVDVRPPTLVAADIQASQDAVKLTVLSVGFTLARHFHVVLAPQFSLRERVFL